LDALEHLLSPLTQVHNGLPDALELRLLKSKERTVLMNAARVLEQCALTSLTQS
jgi:hypothetical protein